MNLWLLIAGMGVITYAIRLSMILLSDRFTLPPGLRRALRYVPVAVLSAIIVPELLLPSGRPDVSFGNLRLLAGVVALAVAYVSKNVLWTVALGLGTLWLLQALL